MTVHVLTTGGTIDKVYFDELSEFKVGESTVAEIFREAGVTFAYTLEAVLKKDSLDITDDDRQRIRARVMACESAQVLITHGTDTMVQTADVLRDVGEKTIVLTGAMQPARLRATDAIFNIGFAVAALQVLPAGVYIAMNGRVFEAGKVRKNRAAGRFESAPRG